MTPDAMAAITPVLLLVLVFSVPALAATCVIAFYSYRTAAALRLPWLWAIAIFVPCVNAMLFPALIWKAARECRAAGIPFLKLIGIPLVPLVEVSKQSSTANGERAPSIETAIMADEIDVAALATAYRRLVLWLGALTVWWLFWWLVLNLGGALLQWQGVFG